MRCEKAEKLLALESGGDLPGGRDRALAGHLEMCERCRTLSRDLAGSSAWMRGALEAPVSETSYAEIRREVWRRIEAGYGGSTAPAMAGRLALTAAGLFAAVLAALLLARKAPQEPPLASIRPSATQPARGAPALPASPVPEAAAVPAPAAELVHVAAARPRAPARRRPAVPARESTVERIEFQTANPNVRIIWLVRKGEEKSSSRTPSRIEEVS